MTDLRLTTAGESHGPAELCVLEGVPAGLSLVSDDVNAQLARRQKGYGRGGRMAIEHDRCTFLAGVRLGVTIGSPIAIAVENRDHQSWLASMSPEPMPEGEAEPPATAVPRPGHADYAGMLKFGHSELRPVLERASARETVARVAGGAVCRRLLGELGVSLAARVISLGEVVCDTGGAENIRPSDIDWESVEQSAVGCEDRSCSEKMCRAIDAAREKGESLGGVFEVWAWGLCPGLGDGTRFAKRLDGRIMGAVGGIPAIKGVEIGTAFDNATLPGSKVHDAFELSPDRDWHGVGRATNRAGGLEGGMTNGMPLVVRAAMKPIPTLTQPMGSVDLETLQETSAHVERSDVTAVPAARVVGEAMVALVLAEAYLEKFGGDSLRETQARVTTYVGDLEERGLWRRS